MEEIAFSYNSNNNNKWFIAINTNTNEFNNNVR